MVSARRSLHKRQKRIPYLQNPSHSHIIYSDDHGTSWKIGGIVDEGTNECAVVQQEADPGTVQH